MTLKQRQRRENNRQYIRTKKALGWKYLAFILPPEVIRSVQRFKNQEMAEYRATQSQEVKG